MVDTPRSLAALQALFADNTSGNISPQDLRDFLVSCEDTMGTLARSGSPYCDTPRGMNLVKQGLVLEVGGGGAWDEGLVESPCVFFDPVSGRYAMVYVGYNEGGTVVAKIGLAYADDPAGPWEKVATPILGGSGSGVDSSGCSGPLVVWKDGTYYLFYIGLTAPGYEQGTKRLCLATATSLTGTWTRLGAVISPSGSGWRAIAIWHPNVVRAKGRYYLFFNATGGDNVESIGYAVADVLTGPWVVDDVNSPVVSKGASGWDSGWVGDPAVFWTGAIWLMAYYGYDYTHAYDGYAWTTPEDFPLGWQKFAGNPVLSPGPDAYDSGYACKPFIFLTPTTLYHYYTAVNGERQIALATASLGWPLPRTVTGSRGGNAALGSLLTALEGLGLIVDSTT